MSLARGCLLVGCVLVAGCPSTSTQRASAAAASSTGAVALQLGEDIPPAVQERIRQLLSTALGDPPVVVPASSPVSGVAPSTLLLALGRTSATQALIPRAELLGLGSEGFVLRKGVLGQTRVLAAIGNPRAGARSAGGSMGSVFGAYAALEALGFGFFHPLAPSTPASLPRWEDLSERSEAPAWPVRGLHLHTVHPLELSDLLNGWGPHGPSDAAGFRAQLPEWDRVLEWLLANRQNQVEWALTWAADWAAFADSPERQARLKVLVDRAHAFGLEAGIDASIAFGQQHTFKLIRAQGTLDSEVQQIHTHLDWLFGAGFDFLSTEAGTTEFTHPDPQRMLAWMDEVTRYTTDVLHARARIKVHCSTGETAAGFVDPDTQEPLNFNFLPSEADARLGVMPHTVQPYSLDDPAPTYGNRDFSAMHRFLKREAGRREVVWYPESAYWVTVDVDVPLFLPVYAERRVHDLRLLGGEGVPFQGQMLFSSGWEWGYWLNDVVAARAAWNPHLEQPADHDALVTILRDVLGPLGGVGSTAADLVAKTAEAEHDLLILGKVNGVPPPDVERRNGLAYLAGVDTWDDIESLAHGLLLPSGMVTQPEKLGLVAMRNPFHAGPSYSLVAPLLSELETTLTSFAEQFQRVKGDAGAGPGAEVLSELADAAQVTALRAVQVHALYDGVDAQGHWGFQVAGHRFAAARSALLEASGLVRQREEHYRVPLERVAGWEPGPTSYPFRYLWMAHSLHLWWRDQGKAERAPLSPCYMNVISPVDVVLGEGSAEDAAQFARDVLGQVPLIDSVVDCLAAPEAEPSYPPPGL